MTDPVNMPCARVCLSRLSPKDLPPNALEQFYFYTAEKKKGSDTSLLNKEYTARGSPYLVNQGGDKSKKENSSFAIRNDHVYRSIRPSSSKEQSRSTTDRDVWKAKGSVPTMSNVNKLFGAVFLSPVPPVSCIQSCSTKDLNAFAWKHKTQGFIVDSGVNGHEHFSDLSSTVYLNPCEVSGLQQENSSSRNDGTKNFSTGKDKLQHNCLGLSPVTALCKKHNLWQSNCSSSNAGESNTSKVRLFPPHLGHSGTQCANKNEGEERKDENLSGETQHSKDVTSEWGRSDSCFNSNAKKSETSRYKEDMVRIKSKIHSTCERDPSVSETSRYKEDMVRIKSEIHSTCELDPSVSSPLLRVAYEQLRQGTISAPEEDGQTQAGENVDLHFSASCSSSLSDRTLYKDKFFWLQDGGSYSPPESRESSVENSTNDFSSQGNGCLGIQRNKKTFDKIVEKKRRMVPPVDINNSHVDKPEQSTKSEAASTTTLDNSVHLRNASARHLLGTSGGLLTAEIKLVPLDMRGRTIISADRIVHKQSNRGKSSRGEGPKHNLVVKIVDLGNNVGPPSKARNSSVSQIKKQCTNFDRKIPNYCQVVPSKDNVKYLPTLDKGHKRKRKSQGNTAAIDTKDSAVKKTNKQRKRVSKDPAGRKVKIPKQYQNTKFSEIQTIRGIKTRYKVAFAKWPNVFTGALNIINQRIVSQNTLLHFLGKEESMCLK